MTRKFSWLLVAFSVGLLCTGDVFGRGGFGGGGGRGGGFGGGGGRDFGGGGRDFGGGDRGDFGGGDRNFGGDRGGDFSADRFGGYGGDRYGNFNGDRGGNFGDGNRGAGDRNWQSAYNGSRFADGGLGRYSAINANHGTRNWSQGDIANRASAVRNNFGYQNCFHPNWNVAHPGCWFAAGWAAGSAWTWATWPVMSTWCAFPGPPAYYDYGSNIVYQDDNVYYDGNPVCTAQQYAQQATTLADQGQTADAPDSDQWQPLGVFSLVQGDETTSNNLFQLAVNKQGIIRGNYYDGLMDTTTPVYGSVDKKNQRAAWTIGKKNDRVFETGIYNLTKSEAPVLVHFGGDKTQQWLLVRQQDQQQGQTSPSS